MRILGLLIGLVLLCSNASATIILSFSGGSFATDSGVQTINVFARSTATPGESTLFLTSDFTLGGARFAATPGTFGGAGFIGNGNITGGAASSFNRDAANSRIAYLSLDFSTAQAFPSADTLLATLSIDTTGAALGTYSINASASSEAPMQVNAGSFTITAVPEPTSMALVGLCVVGLVVRRVVRARKKKTTL